MTCWQCGTPLPPDVGFCRACGAFVRPRSAPVDRPGVAKAVVPRVTAPPPDLASAPPPAAEGAWYEVPPPPASSTPRSAGWGTPPLAPTTARSAWPAVPMGTWAPSQSVVHASTGPANGPSSTTSDLVTAAGTGVVLISLLISWYQVTITVAGLRYVESIERALFPRLFPGLSAGLGGQTGPFSTSVTALGKGAGGWRWAILVVSGVLLLEILLALGSGASRPTSAAGPHTAIVLVLTITNLILVAAAFFTFPFSESPPAYLTVTRGTGAYLGLFAALVACAGAVARLVRSREVFQTLSG